MPEPKPGEPARKRPETAVLEAAWVPTIPAGPAGGEPGQELYAGLPPAYIIRSLSLVPDELRAHVELEQVQYISFPKFFDWTYQHHEGLSRAQVELVAGRISAFNECFY